MKVVSPEDFAAARAARRSNFRLMKGNRAEIKERQKRGKDIVAKGHSRLNGGHLPPKAERQARSTD